MSNPGYITKDGFEKMKEELRYLKMVKKREVADRIEKAKELGDLSENAEYADAKDEMSFIEGKIIELEDYVNRAVVIDHTQTDVVQVGSTVIVKNKEGEKTYTIVGANEADPLGGKISNETPLAQALLGKAKGDEIELTVPAGKISYKIVKIS